MTTSPIAGDSQIANALTTLGTTALGSTRNELLVQAIVAAANATGGSGGAVWGAITGTLSAQTDLQAALDAKLALAGGTMTGALINSTNGAASTPSLLLSGTPFTGGTGTTTKPLFLIETAGATSAGWNVDGTMFGVNAPSGSLGHLINAQRNGRNRFTVFADETVAPQSSVLDIYDDSNFHMYMAGSVMNTSRGDGLYIQYSGTKAVWFCNATSKIGDKLLNFNEDVGIARTSAANMKVTDGAAGRGTLDAAGYQVGGVAGANFSGVATNITVVNGIITAIS
jgi:hypothetical protein